MRQTTIFVYSDCKSPYAFLAKDLIYELGVHNTYFWIDLKKHITAVDLMQILPIGDPHVQATMMALEWASRACKAIVNNPFVYDFLPFSLRPPTAQRVILQ